MILKQGDCLELIKEIEDKTVDLILCDPPYGTTACKWDAVIPFEPLWEQYERVIKDNGAIVLFGSQPFTTNLINSNIKLFKYCFYWKKSKGCNFVHAKNMPLKIVEDIVVFSKAGIGHKIQMGDKRMEYFPQGVEVSDSVVKQNKNTSELKFHRESQANHKEEGYKCQGKGYPTSLLEFGSKGKSIHPTQKPVALLEYLIKTYTRENEIVLDNCMGSGSTGVACTNTNRDFIGFELDEKYFKIAENRIQETICDKNDIPMIKSQNNDTSLNESA